ncbi:hypothetical protein BO94DRAFT_572873 [Aspergillus sclerotioniger CBS 115572]|uniref:BZIP domain-containing protein n=1 Tax=Aspergillus sclerotioniger CBS 115572 TaxID=1450535 RepID=A0A317X708_9EURO|nr:hypothetical protein BO94DRAFT_572873 [Aspergillus sclerotioniger CBS 115572]PWY93422.1 hypothetical protein BO94DRAFT_572873 [Aspergillus sclerotioniger CBS 115572]
MASIKGTGLKLRRSTRLTKPQTRFSLPSPRSGSSGSKDPATSIQGWLSLQSPCTTPARPPRSSTRSEKPPTFDYQHHYQHLQQPPHYSDPFYLPPEFHPIPQLAFSDFDLSSSAAFPPVDTSLFYESPDTSLPGSALSSLSDSSYQDQIIGFDPSCAPLPPLIPVTAADPDPIDALLSSPDSLNLFQSPSVQSAPANWTEFSEPSPPQMPAVSNTASPLNLSRADTPKETPNRVKKRELNTMAARRYRQRRLDRMNQLEEELEAIKRERDELKMRVSKLEGETEALRSMVKGQK